MPLDVPVKKCKASSSGSFLTCILVCLMKWFSLKPAIFSEMSLTYKGILGRQRSHVVTVLITTKFTLPNHVLRDELEFKNLN